MTTTQAQQNYKTAQEHVNVYADEMNRLNSEITRLNVLLDRMADEGAAEDKQMAIAAKAEMLDRQRTALRPRLNEWLCEMVRWEDGD